MFCPKCGNPDQSPETYCRRCGVFLPDLSKPSKTTTPEDHVRANTALSAITILVSFTLAILIYLMLAFRPDTHPLIYVTAGLLIAIGAWHIQTLWRTLLLKKHLQKIKPPKEIALTAGAVTGNLLEPADFENAVPPSVTERTTRHLSETKPRSS